MLHRRALAMLALAACGVPDGDYFGRVDRAEAGHLRWCNQAEPDYLDPAKASSTQASPIISLLFDALTTYGPDGLPVPSLATRWDVSPDLRVWTFHLRDDARWSNGRAITAYDVAFAAMRVLHPTTASPNADNLAPLVNAVPYLQRAVFRLRADVPPHRAGDIVTPAAADPPDVSARTASRPLALRDLGAPATAAYATVPPRTEVALIATSGGPMMPPAPDGTPWAYVFWPRDASGVYGWVPAAELDGEPQAAATIALAGGGTARGDQLAFTPDVLGVRVLDAHTLELTCAAPTPFFLAATNNRALRTVPIEAVSRWPTTWTRPEHVITSGPMHLATWRERDLIELVRSPTYWNPGEVKLDRITIFPMDDQAAATNFYFAGHCDATASNEVPSTYLPALNGELRGRPFKDYDVSPYLGVYFLWLNTKQLPDRHLRRALAYAIDRTQIPRFTHGAEIPTAQLTPGTPIARLTAAERAACGIVDPQTKGVALLMDGGLCYVPPPGLDYDPARARAELALARAAGGVPTRLRYLYNAGSEAHKQIAEYAQAAWKAIGLDVELEAQEWNAMLEATRAGEFQIARLGNIGNVADTESEFLPLFTCASNDNRGRYCNPRYEALLAAARGQADRRARNATLREAEAVMIEDAPVIPIYVYTQKHLIKPYVRDYPINLIDQPALWRVSIDPAWRPR